jgi:uncharacterized membrane protein YfcA
MIPELINFILIIFLVMIQSILGIGVLVLGTPTLLLLNFSMIDTMNYLLPISIITSLFNLIIIKIKNNSFDYDQTRLRNFFIICVPFVLVGLIILKYLHEFINFDYVVSTTIILTLIFRVKISIILKGLSLKLNKIILMIIGIIHGITNSGGTLLSILLVNLNTTKKKSRNEITLFYFFLALIQFILFYFLFDLSFNIYYNFLVIIYIIIGVVLGNVLLNYTRESQFQKLIYFLAFISSASLILKNII